VVETRSGSNARRNIPGLSQSVIAVHAFNDVKDQLMKYHTLAARPHNARPMHDWLGISIRVMYTKVHHLLSMVGTGASPTGAKILASQVVEHERGCVRVCRCGSVVGVI